MARYPELLDDDLPPLPPPRRGWGSFVLRHFPALSVTVMVALLMIVVLWPYVVITVPSGRVGVLWKRLNGFDLYCWCFVGRGTVLDPRELREEGLHIIAPWDKLFLYDLRLRSTTQTINAISHDGVSVAAQINVRYQLLHDHVAVLHKFIGPDFLDSVVIPEIGSQAREVISRYNAEEVYKSRDKIQTEIRESTRKSLGANLNQLVQPEAMEQPDPKHYNDFLQDAIEILDTLVLSIELPPDIVAAINRQTEEFYQIQEYKFRVEREAEESKRKQIEANGIAAFQRTVSQGISDSYLRWRGIEATLALARSNNSKIVVIGSGKDGLPIILGNVDNPTVQTGAPPTGVNGAAAPTPPAPTVGEKESEAAAAAATTPKTPRSDTVTEVEPSTGKPVKPEHIPPGDRTAPAHPSDIAPPAGQQSNQLSAKDVATIESFLARLSTILRLNGPPPAGNGGTAPPPKQ